MDLGSMTNLLEVLLNGWTDFPSVEYRDKSSVLMGQVLDYLLAHTSSPATQSPQPQPEGLQANLISKIGPGQSEKPSSQDGRLHLPNEKERQEKNERSPWRYDRESLQWYYRGMVTDD